MGGDNGTVVTVPAAIRALKQYPNLELLLVGQEQALRNSLQAISLPSSLTTRLELVPAEQVVEMGDKPVEAVRKKRKSSMRVAMDLVKNNNAKAMVSAGNTGALMAMGKVVLKTLLQVDRPAIVTTIPAHKGHFHMLDLGANVDCDAQQLYQFALMGAVLCSAIDGIPNPRIGLLNIGEEQIKGNEQVKLAQTLIEQHVGLNYIGFVEGDSIFSGVADVVVCDGFVGNVSLKSIEGVAKMMAQMVRDEVRTHVFLKILMSLALPFCGSLKKKLDPNYYNGASLIGLRATVVKSHGGANIEGLLTALALAFEEVQKDVPTLISERLAHFE